MTKDKIVKGNVVKHNHINIKETKFYARARTYTHRHIYIYATMPLITSP